MFFGHIHTEPYQTVVVSWLGNMFIRQSISQGSFKCMLWLLRGAWGTGWSTCQTCENSKKRAWAHFWLKKKTPHKICLTSAMVIPECLSALKHKCLSVRVSEGVGSECSHSYCSTFLQDTNAQCAMCIAHCATSYSAKKIGSLLLRFCMSGRYQRGATWMEPSLHFSSISILEPGRQQFSLISAEERKI